MATQDDRDNMTVGELRQWLVKFGEQNQDHYTKNRLISKAAAVPNFSIQERIQQVEQRSLLAAVTTTTVAVAPPPQAAKETELETTKVALYQNDKPISAEPNVSYHDSEDFKVIKYHDPPAIVEPEPVDQRSVPIFRTFDGNNANAAVEDQHDLAMVSKNANSCLDNENYRIVAIEKLLDPPVPPPRSRRTNSFGSWDDFDDFSDPWTNPSNVLRQHSLLDDDDGVVDDKQQEQEVLSVAATDPGAAQSFSRQLARRLKKSKKQQVSNSKSSKPKVGMFRRKFPSLLCKSVKEVKNAEDSAAAGISPSPPTLFDIAAASAPVLVAPTKQQQQQETVTTEPVHDDDDVVPRTDSPMATQMHSASLFQGKTLTSNTLDLLCNIDNDPTADTTTTNKYQQQQHEHYHGGHARSSPTSLSEEDQETVSTWSQDSGQPSIAPGALDARLGQVFAEEVEQLDNNSDILASNESQRETRMLLHERDETTRTKLISFEPRQQAAVQPEMKQRGETSRQTSSTVAKKWQDRVESSTSSDTSSSTTTGSSSGAGAAGDPASASAALVVSSVVYRFGGSAGRKTAIQQRTDELELKWAAERVQSHVKKVKWQVCARTGAYKRQIVLDFESA